MVPSGWNLGGAFSVNVKLLNDPHSNDPHAQKANPATDLWHADLAGGDQCPVRLRLRLVPVR